MKRMILWILVVMLGFANVADAQTGKKGSKQQTTKGKATAKKARTKNAAAKNDTVSMASASNNQAYGNAPARRFSIADPTVNMLNQRANGVDVPVSSSGIVGMPKGTYGFANGRIFLRNTTATSSGTNYGSGAVGTGTTIIGVGAGENAIGVNGKNPYAGPWLWGSRNPSWNLPATDSSRRGQ